MEKGQTIADFQLRLSLFLLVVAGAFMRLWGLGDWDYYHDEVWHLYVSAQRNLTSVFYMNFAEDGHPVLPYFIWHYAREWWDNPWAVRLPSLVAGIASIPLAYGVGRLWLGTRGAGLFLAFFVAFSGVMMEQSSVVRGYALMVMFGLVALYAIRRYGQSHRLGFLLLYFIALALALLCEFSAAPLALFCGLYGLHALYAQRPWPWVHSVAYGLIHLALLAYMLAFLWAQHRFSPVDFSGAPAFTLPWKWQTTALLYGYYVARALYEATPFYSLLQAADGVGTPTFLILIALFFIALLGVWQLVQTKSWAVLLLALIPLLAIGLFYEAQLVPLGFVRRHIMVVLSFALLLWAGLEYLAKRNPKIVGRPLGCMLAASVIIVGSHALFHRDWRAANPYEFHQTVEDTARIQTWFEEIEPGDIILTDKGSSYYLRRYFAPCNRKTLTSDVDRMPCYRVPIYLAGYDMRTTILNMPLESLQRLARTLEQESLLPRTGRIWLVGFQHIDIKNSFMNPEFGNKLRATVEATTYDAAASELNRMVQEQRVFAESLFDQAAPQRVLYGHNCAQDVEAVHPMTATCPIIFAALAVSPEFVRARLVHAPDYADTKAFIDRLAQPH